MKPETVGKDFQEGTKYRYFRTPSDMERRVRMPDPKKPVPQGTEIILLPPVERKVEDTCPFLLLLESRRSRRQFAPVAVTTRDLSILLWGTQGILSVIDGHSLRTSPSAGARHPLETYLVINRVEGFEPGLYRYLPFEHSLAALDRDPGYGKRLADACLGQGFLRTSAVDFIWTTVFQRSRWKYQQRGYRYIYLDAGHVCQNLYLTCEYLGLSCCAVGAFDDDAVDELIGVDGKEEFTLYLAAVGRRRGDKATRA